MKRHYQGQFTVVVRTPDGKEVSAIPESHGTDNRQEMDEVDSLALNADAMYTVELKMHSSVRPVDDSGRKFLIPDCIKSGHNSGKLMNTQYVLIEREFMQCIDGICWLYTCSCEKSRASLAKSLNTSASSSSCNEISRAYCRHITCAMPILIEYDLICAVQVEDHMPSTDHSYGLGSGENIRTTVSQAVGNIHYFIIPHRPHIGIVVDGVCGVVARVGQCIKCLLCHSVECIHASSIMRLVNEVDEDHQHSDIPDYVLYTLLMFKRATDSSTSSQQDGMDSEHINKFYPTELKWQPDMQLQEKMRMELAHCQKDEHGTICLMEECCLTCGGSVTVTGTVQKVVILSLNVVPVNVSHVTCTECGAVSPYSGRNDAMMHMPTVIVSHNILRRYLHSFITSGMTTNSFLESLKAEYRDRGVALAPSLSYHKFKCAWYDFLSMLELPSEGFLCSTCQQCPSVLVCDGTTLSIRKDMWPDECGRVPTTGGTAVLGCRLPEYLYVPSSNVRKMLVELTECKVVEATFQQLLTTLPLPLNALLWKICVLSHGCYHIPSQYKPLLLSMCGKSPASAVFKPSLALDIIFEKLGQGEDLSGSVGDMTTIHQSFPVLHTLIATHIPLPNQQLADLLQDVARFIRQGYQSYQAQAATSQDIIQVNQVNKTSCFPGLPQIRRRRNYDADQVPVDKICTKKGVKRNSLMPGLFTVFCQHGVCYGYQVMQSAESPNNPFSAVYEHFHTAPKYIIYDNACHLHVYALRREPWFFKDTTFLVDRFHWPNHTGCSAGYNLKLYGGELATINSQIVEQFNRKIKTLKSSLPYMSFQNFIKHIHLYISQYNVK